MDPRYANRRTFEAERWPEHYRIINAMELGQKDNAEPATISALEVAYGLAPGAVERVLEGGDLEAAPESAPAPVTLARPLAGSDPGDDMESLLDRIPEAARPYATRVADLYRAATIRTGNGDPPGSEIFGTFDTWAGEAWERLRRRNPSVIDRLVIISSATVPEEEANPARGHGRERGTAAGLAPALSSAGGAA